MTRLMNRNRRRITGLSWRKLSAALDADNATTSGENTADNACDDVRDNVAIATGSKPTMVTRQRTVMSLANNEHYVTSADNRKRKYEEIETMSDDEEEEEITSGGRRSRQTTRLRRAVGVIRRKFHIRTRYSKRLANRKRLGRPTRGGATESACNTPGSATVSQQTQTPDGPPLNDVIDWDSRLFRSTVNPNPNYCSTTTGAPVPQRLPHTVSTTWGIPSSTQPGGIPSVLPGGIPARSMTSLLSRPTDMTSSPRTPNRIRMGVHGVRPSARREGFMGMAGLKNLSENWKTIMQQENINLATPVSSRRPPTTPLRNLPNYLDPKVKAAGVLSPFPSSSRVPIFV